VAKASKAPKSFTFAMKSTDKMSFFENTDDYVHVFSCNDREGSDWMEKILLARVGTHFVRIKVILLTDVSVVLCSLPGTQCSRQPED